MSGGSEGKPDRQEQARKRLVDAELQREIDAALGDASLDEILAAEDAAGAPPRGVRRGRVVDIHGEDVFVDMGGKSQGLVPLEQFSEEEAPPEPGDVIEVTIEGYDETDGLLLLSRKGAVRAATWDTIEVDQIVEGRVTGHNKGGLELNVNGIRAFLPVSQIEIYRVEDVSEYVGQRLRCMVTEVDLSNENVILSRRDLLEAEAAAAREKLFDTLAEGQVVSGVVRSVMPYGAFVDIGGADGLLHVSDMSYGRVFDPHEIVTEGQQIEVKVLKVDRDERKISLGLKQVLPDPWQDVEGKWAIDSITRGRVTRLADFGAFVELEPGVEGLVPISELSYERIRHPREVVSPGDMVNVCVLTVDTERRRIGLSVKRAGDDPWTGASVRWPVGSVVTGIVTRAVDFGAFVELVPGVEGLIHISELAYGHVRSVSQVVHEGETVQAKVLSVDEDNRRMSLSIKELGYTTGGRREGPEPQKPQVKKRKKPLKGGLD